MELQKDTPEWERAFNCDAGEMADGLVLTTKQFTKIADCHCDVVSETEAYWRMEILERKKHDDNIEYGWWNFSHVDDVTYGEYNIIEIRIFTTYASFIEAAMLWVRENDHLADYA